MVKDPLSEMLREGARLLIATAVRGELEDFMEQYKDRRLEDGRVAVVRNGYLPERDIQTGLGSVKVQIPKVRSKDGKPVVFHSALVPRYVRKTATLEAALPWLYLKGISTGEMGPALDALIGPEAKGLSQSTVSRLKRKWAEQYRGWRGRSLDEDQWVYVWADGIYSNIRAEDSKMCALVLIGVNQRGEKHFLAIENGVRESKQSWLGVFQGSCRIFCFIRPNDYLPTISMSNCFQSYQAAFSQLSGLSRTSRISDQSRVLPDQRLGFFSLACS